MGDFADEAPTNPPWLVADQHPPVDFVSIEAQFLADICANPQDLALRTTPTGSNRLAT